MKSTPELMKYMTTSPHSIGTDQSLATAQSLMGKNKIRHLPILEGGKILGMITDRDIKLATSLLGASAEKTKVADVYQPDPYIVSPHSKLHDVVSHMAEARIGSAIVADNNKLVGIFTDTDAMRALAVLLETKLKD